MQERKISTIRKNIRKRKNLVRLKKNQKAILPQITTEEKHGFSSPIQDTVSLKYPAFIKLVVKVALSFLLIIFAKLTISKHPVIPADLQVKAENAFTEDFPFAKFYIWYKDSFGTPISFISDKEELITVKNDMNTESLLPVQGQVEEEGNMELSINPIDYSEVRTIDDGVVIFRGKDRETSQETIIIQHPDQSKTYYKNVSSFNKHLYEFVSKNEVIAYFDSTKTKGNFYFSIEKDKQQLDPLQVIKIE